MNLEHLLENGKIVETINPGVTTSGINGVAVSMKHYRRAIILVSYAQGNAATILMTPQQCTAVAGTGAKALTQNCQIYANEATGTSDAWVKQTDAKNFTSSAALANKLFAFVIDAASLDQANSFDCLRLITGASNAANIISAQIILVQPRYADATPPSARVD